MIQLKKKQMHNSFLTILISLSMQNCLKKTTAKNTNEEPSDASRFAALRYDGSVTYLFQALVAPSSTPEEFKNSANVYQCWYRHDTPKNEEIASSGTDNLELFQKYKNNMQNVNVFAVPTDTLSLVMEEINASVYAKDENGNDIDPSKGGIQGVLEQINEQAIDAVYSGVVIAENALEDEANPENRLDEPDVLQSADGTDTVLVMPTRFISCPSALELAGLQGNNTAMSEETLKLFANDKSAFNLGEEFQSEKLQAEQPQLNFIVPLIRGVIIGSKFILRGGPLLRNTRAIQMVSSASRLAPRAAGKFITKSAKFTRGTIPKLASDTAKAIASSPAYAADKASRVGRALKQKSILNKISFYDDALLNKLGTAAKMSQGNIAKVKIAQNITAAGAKFKPFTVTTKVNTVNGVGRTLSHTITSQDELLRFLKTTQSATNQGTRQAITGKIFSEGTSAATRAGGNKWFKLMGSGFNTASWVWTGWELKEMLKGTNVGDKANEVAGGVVEGVANGALQVTDKAHIVLNTAKNPKAKLPEQVQALYNFESEVRKQGKNLTEEDKKSIQAAREEMAKPFEDNCPDAARYIRNGGGAASVEKHCAAL
jgi:hypothetical protein